MPILDVEIVVPGGSAVPDGLAATIADAAGFIFESSAGQTWVRVRELPLERYAENGGGPDRGVPPVFVRVLKAVVPEEPALEREASALTAAVARACGRPVENVHVLYEPPAMGRIAFGGKLLKTQARSDG